MCSRTRVKLGGELAHTKRRDAGASWLRCLPPALHVVSMSLVLFKYNTNGWSLLCKCCFILQLFLCVYVYVCVLIRYLCVVNLKRWKPLGDGAIVAVKQFGLLTQTDVAPPILDVVT